MRPPALPAVLLVALLAAGCQSSPPAREPLAEPTSTGPVVTAPATRPATASPTRRPAARPRWVVGASPLPLRADGFGQVLATPLVLRDRSLPTVDVLPPPTDGRFHATTGPITAALRVRMGDTYRPGCPVPLSALRYLTLSFRGFDGRAHTGELVVAATAAPSAVRVFRALFAQGFPLEQMRLPSSSDVGARPTGDGNDTAGFLCRAAIGQTRFSAHAYGLAIDVNPFDNPYVRGDLVLPELASAYVDRGWVRPGMFEPSSAAVRAFTREGWTWGGSFHSLKDYQHFSLTGG
jgi:hypothetical protein